MEQAHIFLIKICIYCNFWGGAPCQYIQSMSGNFYHSVFHNVKAYSRDTQPPRPTMGLWPVWNWAMWEAGQWTRAQSCGRTAYMQVLAHSSTCASCRLVRTCTHMCALAHCFHGPVPLFLLPTGLQAVKVGDRWPIVLLNNFKYSLKIKYYTRVLHFIFIWNPNVNL